MSHNELRRLIWHDLKNEVIYSKNDYTYSLKLDGSIEKGGIVTQAIHRKDGWEFFIQEFSAIDVLHGFIAAARNHYIKVDSGNKKIDKLIKAVVKDNVITEIEEKFLIKKCQELRINTNVISNAKKSLLHNNPYLDNLIHILFEEAKFSHEEILFIKDKTEENKLNKEFVNQRFWIIGINDYLTVLRKINKFDDIIKMWGLFNYFNNNPYMNILNFIKKIDIFSASGLDGVIGKWISKFENELLDVIKDAGFNNINLTAILSEIKIGQCTQESNMKSNVEIISRFIKIVEDERLRLGTPDANLLAENILFKIERQL